MTKEEKRIKAAKLIKRIMRFKILMGYSLEKHDYDILHYLVITSPHLIGLVTEYQQLIQAKTDEKDQT